MLEFKFDTQLLIEGHDLDEDAINEYFTTHFWNARSRACRAEAFDGKGMAAGETLKRLPRVLYSDCFSLYFDCFLPLL